MCSASSPFLESLSPGSECVCPDSESLFPGVLLLSFFLLFSFFFLFSFSFLHSFFLLFSFSFLYSFFFLFSLSLCFLEILAGELVKKYGDLCQNYPTIHLKVGFIYLLLKVIWWYLGQRNWNSQRSEMELKFVTVGMFVTDLGLACWHINKMISCLVSVALWISKHQISFSLFCASQISFLAYSFKEKEDEQKRLHPVQSLNGSKTATLLFVSTALGPNICKIFAFVRAVDCCVSRRFKSDVCQGRCS